MSALPIRNLICRRRWPMRSKLSILICLLLAASITLAQGTDNNFNVGFPPNGIFSGSNFDSVQVTNGNLHIEIPVWSTDGRGLDIGTKFVYNSKGWKEHVHCVRLSGTCHADIQPDHGIGMGLVNPFSY